MTIARPNAHHSDRVQSMIVTRVHVRKSKSKRNIYTPYVIEFTESKPFGIQNLSQIESESSQATAEWYK